ncbi:MAG: hypothetical protein GXY03_10690 [Solirubrobacterales bacterium]|nr:hypothetical protein [Solirubrobacterales bacterium]
MSDVSIEWYPRDTWVRYLSSGTGAQDGLFATNGATKMAPFTTAAHPCSNGTYGGAPSDTFDYGYTYAAKSGWYDESDQSAAIYGQGTVRFVWKGHTVDLAASDIELELNSTAPRSIFRFSGSGGTAYPNQRAVLTELDLAGQPQVSGNTRTYTALDTALTEDGSSVFAGFYAAGDPFGCVSVSFKVPS